MNAEQKQELYTNIPEELKQLKSWINWKLEIRNGKETKIPYQTNGRLAKPNDASTWSTFDTAVSNENSYSGIGFVFSFDTRYIAIDLDHCFTDGILAKEAKKWVDRFGSYTEISQSGTGLHIIVKSNKLEIYRELKNNYNADTGKKSAMGELYIDKRYFALTGNVYDSHVDVKEAKIPDVLSFLEYITNTGKNQSKTDRVSPQMTDETILSKATNAKNGFVFTELYNTPGQSGESEGDQSICNILAFYTQDIEQIKRVLRYSPRYRGKFDRDDYLDRTIQRAIDGLTSTYNPEQLRDETLEGWRKSHPWYACSLKLNGGITKKLMPAVLTDYLTDEHTSLSCNNDIYIYKNGVYKKQDKSEIYKITKDKLIKEVAMSAQIEEVYKLWAIDTYIKSNRLNLHKDKINFANCMIRIDKSGSIEKVEHDKLYRSTIQYPIGYTDNLKIDRWEQFLSEVLDPDSILRLQETLGYLLTLDNRAKKLFCLYGPTDCGKSVILSVLTAIVGKEYVSSKTLQQLCDPDKPFAAFALWGKVLNICGDLPATPLKDTGIIKQLTGDDLMDFEQKGKDSFSEYCLARSIFSANQMPASYNDRTDAFYNRLLIISFPRSIPKAAQDEYLTQHLINNELEGIVNWALQGYTRLIRNKYAFSESNASTKVLEDYKKANNPTMDFFEECCTFGVEFVSTSSELYANYCKFCTDNGMRPMSSTKFKPELESYAKSRGYFIEYKNRLPELRKRGFIGVKSDYSF